MDYKILYSVFIVTIMTGYSEPCTTEYQNTACMYILRCEGRRNGDIQWTQFIRNANRYGTYNNYGYSFGNDEDEACANSPSGIEYQGRSMYPVKIIIKEDYDNLHNYLFSYGLVNEGILRIICNIDLSDNQFTDIIGIPYMPNLAALNVSRNRLTTAVLSNNNELSHLTDLDLSHNTIQDIKVKPNEPRFTSLVNINMSHNYLVNIPDAIFDDFDNLEYLDLSNNYLESLGPLTFEGMKKLVHLDLSNNRLTDINSSLLRFKGLKILNLSGNKLKNLTLTDFQLLINLRSLDISSNSIISFHANIFDSMILLEILDISDNKIEELNKNMFSSLRSLNDIDISKNKIKKIPVGLFTRSNIIEFSINENILEGSLVQGMFDGVNVTELDLSNQFITEIKDYAFYDLIKLESLLLNGNSIQNLENSCFKTLKNLKRLDLSNNQITSLSFNKEDLSNLLSLLLKHNRLTEIKQAELMSLNNIEYLDISDNMISRLEKHSFNNFNNLINLKINNNPLAGTLQSDTFYGLTSLPDLDISSNMLTEVKNATFNGMSELKKLNLSSCKIKELEYNVFGNTGYIELLDLSYNQLKYFFVNMTELVSLSTLFLNNNQIASISTETFNGLLILNNLSLSHNMIEYINVSSFDTLVDLRYLDLSYNENLNFTAKGLEKLIRLNTLIYSGVKSPVSFIDMKENSSNLVFTMSNASVQNISDLQLKKMCLLITLCLSSNNITNLTIGDFSGLISMLFLDLSFNKISFIQPGVFKENSLLTSLNISHNFISTLNYGIFRGLIYLEILDISFNKIKDLESQRFYEVQSLSQLIVDYNEIKSFNAEEFLGTALKKISIGNNPIPCQRIVNLIKKGLPFVITAIKIDEHSNENIDGITCNSAGMSPQKSPFIENVTTGEDKSNVLPNMLLDLINKNMEREDKNYKYLEKLSGEFEKITDMFNLTLPNNNNNSVALSNLVNITSFINNNTVSLSKISGEFEKISSLVNITSFINDNTVTLSKISGELEKISNLMNTSSIINNNIFSLFNKTMNLSDHIPITQVSGTKTSTSAPVVTATSQTATRIPVVRNDSYLNETANIISYINKIQKELQNSIAIEKQNVLNSMQSKIVSNKGPTEFLRSTISPDQLVYNKNENTKSIFTETCVGLILFILVAFVLYKFYRSRVFARNRYSISTRELPGSMDNSSL